MLRGAVFAASATQSLTLQVRRREHRAALAADLPGPPHPRRRRTLPAHAGHSTIVFVFCSPVGYANLKRKSCSTEALSGPV
jgi:hypothetical protein